MNDDEKNRLYFLFQTRISSYCFTDQFLVAYSCTVGDSLGINF